MRPPLLPLLLAWCGCGGGREGRILLLLHRHPLPTRGQFAPENFKGLPAACLPSPPPLPDLVVHCDQVAEQAVKQYQIQH